MLIFTTISMEKLGKNCFAASKKKNWKYVLSCHRWAARVQSYNKKITRDEKEMKTTKKNNMNEKKLYKFFGNFEGNLKVLNSECFVCKAYVQIQ